MFRSIYIRDPIHGDIYVSEGEKNILDKCRWIQRLHYIKQNGLLYLIFPGAQHSRFSHSLGVMHLVSQYMKNMPQEIQKHTPLIRLAGLFHDVGHGPFSHSWEQAFYPTFHKEYTFYNPYFEMEIDVKINKWHDYLRHKILELPEVSDLIQQETGYSVHDIISCWYHPLYKQIIQGEWGADRLDYLQRDSYFCGTQHFNKYNIERIVHNCYISNGEIRYKEKIDYDLNFALSIRDFMYQHIYFHKKNLLIENKLKENFKNHFDCERIRNLNEDVTLLLNYTDDYVLQQGNFKEFLLGIRGKK